jgi:hypothetical protein
MEWRDMKDFVVYTAITNGYDELKPVQENWRNEADFVAFLDEPQPANGWEIRQIHRRFKDPCRNAKIHKLLPHKYFPTALYSLWVDGSVLIKSSLPLRLWVEQYLSEYDLAVFKHGQRNCAYQEALACIRGRVDYSEVIDTQMEKYFNDDFPLNHGLAECTVLFRRHTKKMRQFNEMWWNEVKMHSRRDQLSFNYVAYKLGFKYAHLPGGISCNPHFDWKRHKKERLKMI